MALSITTGADGRALLYCHAGCAYPDILRALRLPSTALRTEPRTPPTRHAQMWLRNVKFPPAKAAGTIQERGLLFEAEHPYGDPTPVAWKLRYRHPTTGEKAITWESLNPRGERVLGLLGRPQTSLPLYRVREVRMAMAMDEVVVLCESESSVDALNHAGIYATCWPGGAGDVPVEQIHDLLGNYARTVLIPDNDPAGLAATNALLRGQAIRRNRVMLGNEGEDARDVLTRIGPAALRALIEENVR